MAAKAAAIEPLIELKFGQVGIANLRLFRVDPAALLRELQLKVAAAPQLFSRAPLVLDLSRLAQLPDGETARALLDAVRDAGMLPVGLSYGTPENEQLAKTLHLPLFAKFRSGYESGAATEVAAAVTENVAHKASDSAMAAPRAASGQLQRKPVRSGQQVYARGRDLIVNATVGNGAEVIADGSIHVYGALRGRALAGAQGDSSARIYCLDFQPELVSIAGQYRVFEDMPADLRGKPVQVWLEDERLVLEKI